MIMAGLCMSSSRSACAALLNRCAARSISSATPRLATDMGGKAAGEQEDEALPAKLKIGDRETTLYEDLGLPDENATPAEIKDAFYKLSKVRRRQLQIKRTRKSNVFLFL